MANRILILTKSAIDAEILKGVLDRAKDGPFKIEWLTQLSAGLEKLRQGEIDAVLVDLALHDSSGIETFDRLFAASRRTPIMILSGDEDEALAKEAVSRGAQGYLSKGYFGSYLVPQSLQNMIQRKAVEEALFKEKARAEIALNSIGDAVLCTDMFANVDYLNVSAERLTGWSREEAQGRPVNEIFQIVNGMTREPELNTVECVLNLNRPMPLPPNTILIRKDGSEAAIEDSASPIHDRNGKLTGAVIVFHDVSVTQAMSIKMTHLAQHDFLTNLPNRILLNDRIAQAIALAKRTGTQLALLFLDLDNFKNINDSLGHATGDELLQSVAQRLSDCVRGSDTVSRQGGDEFVILLVGGKYNEDAASTADKISNVLARPHVVAKSDLYITTSIGISIYPGDGLDAETLIKSADTAMYSAKDNGRNNYQFFTKEMNVRAVERQHIEANLRRALEKQEFVLHYQPKVNFRSGQISGAEALLRWVHPEWGIVLPERFVRVAEDCGLIVPIGRWVLREACAQMKQWLDTGLAPASIAVNISAVEFRQIDFLEGVQNILRETGLAAHRLQLEITESVLMSDAEASAAILQELKNIGVQLAVDDFGTGYSSLSYLTQFPLDVLKIDQSFVDGIGSSSDNGIIVSAVIGMGHSLKLRVVAEGVETDAHRRFLDELHCEEGQGYLFSHPLEPEQFASLLATGISKTLHSFV